MVNVSMDEEMKNSPIVTIVIPIFNQETYLSYCLASIQGQSYKCLDVILVDDGSTDKTKEICMYYCHNDNRFRYFNSGHRGVSYCRNIGINNAKGEYMTFIDSDDYIEKNHIENLLNTLIKNQCDISMVNFRRIKGELIEETSDIKEDIIIEKNDIVVFMMLHSPLIWNKIYKTTIVQKQCGFDENVNLGEDAMFLLNYILSIKKAYLSSKSTYNYRYHTFGLSKGKRNIEDPLFVGNYINDILTKQVHDNRLIKVGHERVVHSYEVVIKLPETKEEFCLLKDTINKKYVLEYNPFISMRTRIRILMFLIMPYSIYAKFM